MFVPDTGLHILSSSSLHGGQVELFILYICWEVTPEFQAKTVHRKPEEISFNDNKMF